MTSLVSEFIITPVLRQARRFSSSFATEERPASRHNRQRSVEESTSVPENAIMEDDQDVVMVERNAGEGSSSPVPAIAPAPAPTPESTPPPPTSLPTPTTNAVSSSPSQAEGMLRNTPEVTVVPGTLSARQPSSPAPSAPPRTASDAADGPRQANIMRRDPLPEDDGMGELRKKIRSIQEMDIAQNLKAQLVHQLLTEKYTLAQQKNGLLKSTIRPESPMGRAIVPDQNASPESFGALQALKAWNPLSTESAPLELPLTAEDLKPTYAPAVMMDQDGEVESPASDGPQEKRHLGCNHYRRNVKLQCATCERWYTCRMCHDAVEDHVLPRQQTKHMLCMLCGCAQKASDTCARCGESAANYYCGICKLWNDDPNKPIYHCSDCGLCRVGQGLGKDFFHCKKCMACISMTGEHKCIERSIDCDCPICGDYLFNSMKTVVFMQCGHSIHKRCFEMHMETSYRCPICSKSCVNMETQFRNFDLAILAQPMPPEYIDARAIISCNDCSAKSQTTYHWLGLKCSLCNSYNTIQRQLLNMPNGTNQELPTQQMERRLEQLQEEASQRQEQRQLTEPTTLNPGHEREAVTFTALPASNAGPLAAGSQPPGQEEPPIFSLSLPSRSSTPLPAYEVIERARREQEARAQRLGGLPDSLGNGIDVSPPAATIAASNNTPLTEHDLVVAGLLPAPSVQPQQPQHQHQHHRQLTPEELIDFVQVRDGEADDDDDDEDEDTFLDLFWGRDRELDRIPNAGTGFTSLGSPGGAAANEEEDSSSCDDLSSEEEEEEEDDDDENEIVLLGHR
ncbi:hypothetical protein QC764_308440 [Podospora pseudoanserina]|uniref:RING finger and CHY zinc finger domain-containing protein n=1 Tax=Podospora pseudoanserina TaxID=2609844 RepID=A0ABR0IE27_9PEZI|nr:hypothetical protein QC764_308440 [Podospora pseudoanserina]